MNGKNGCGASLWPGGRLDLVFIFNKLNHNKWYAPLIREALNRGLDVEVWADQRDVSGSTKWYEFPEISKFPTFHPTRAPVFRTFKSLNELGALGAVSDAQVIFSHHPPHFKKKHGQMWAHMVTSMFDSYCGMPATAMDQFDVVFYNTPHWLEKGLLYYKIVGQMEHGSALEQSLRKKWVSTGTTQFDHFALCNSAEIKKKRGIPQGVPVVTVYAFETTASFWAQRIFHEGSLFKRILNWLGLPLTYPYMFSKIGRSKFFMLLFKSLKERPALLKEVFTTPSEKDVLRAIEKFCKNNGYFLLIKTRKKNPLKDFHREIADMVIEEDKDLYPFTSAEILTASDMLVTFYSSAGVEAGFRGIPVLNLKPANRRFFIRDQYYLIYRERPSERGAAEEAVFYNDDEGTAFNFSGVSRTWTVNEVVKALPQMKIEDFKINEIAHKQFIKKFVCEGELESAGRVLDGLFKSKVHINQKEVERGPEVNG